jgi:hypothetical protein
MPVAYRSRRVFRAQFQLLVEATLLEHAEARLEAESEAGHRLRARRARRDVERLRLAVELDRHDLARRTFRGTGVHRPNPAHAALEDVLPRLRPYIGLELGAAGSPPAAVVRPPSPALVAASIGGCALAWAATVAEVAARGIAERPSLIAVEVVALLLSPVALTLSATPRPQD